MSALLFRFAQECQGKLQVHGFITVLSLRKERNTIVLQFFLQKQKVNCEKGYMRSSRSI